MKVITPAVVLFVMVLVTSGSSNPVFRVPVTCGYSAERGYIVSKKAFLSTLEKSELNSGWKWVRVSLFCEQVRLAVNRRLRYAASVLFLCHAWLNGIIGAGLSFIPAAGFILTAEPQGFMKDWKY